MQWTSGWKAASCHLFLVRGAQEATLGLAVLQNVPYGPAIQGGIDRHAHMPGHPNGQVRHDPPGTVSRENRDTTSRFPVLRLEVGCHAADLIGHLPSRSSRAPSHRQTAGLEKCGLPAPAPSDTVAKEATLLALRSSFFHRNCAPSALFTSARAGVSTAYFFGLTHG